MIQIFFAGVSLFFAAPSPTTCTTLANALLSKTLKEIPLPTEGPVVVSPQEEAFIVKALNDLIQAESAQIKAASFLLLQQMKEKALPALIQFLNEHPNLPRGKLRSFKLLLEGMENSSNTFVQKALLAQYELWQRTKVFALEDAIDRVKKNGPTIEETYLFSEKLQTDSRNNFESLQKEDFLPRSVKSLEAVIKLFHDQETQGKIFYCDPTQPLLRFPFPDAYELQFKNLSTFESELFFINHLQDGEAELEQSLRKKEDPALITLAKKYFYSLTSLKALDALVNLSLKNGNYGIALVVTDALIRRILFLKGRSLKKLTFFQEELTRFAHRASLYAYLCFYFTGQKVNPITTSYPLTINRTSESVQANEIQQLMQCSPLQKDTVIPSRWLLPLAALNPPIFQKSDEGITFPVVYDFFDKELIQLLSAFQSTRTLEKKECSQIELIEHLTQKAFREPDYAHLPASAIKQLVRFFEATNTTVDERKGALQILFRHSDPSQVEPILSQVSPDILMPHLNALALHGYVKEQQLSEKMLRALGPKAIDYYHRLSKDRGARLYDQTDGLDVFARVFEQESLNTNLELLRESTLDINLRAYAARQLPRYRGGAEIAIPYLLEIVRTDRLHVELRSAAAEALGRLSKEVFYLSEIKTTLEALAFEEDVHPTVTAGAIHALRNFVARDKLETLALKILKRKNTSPQLQIEVLRILSSAQRERTSTVKQIVELLRDPRLEPAVIAQALETLSRFENEALAAKVSVERLTQSPDVQIRNSARYFLRNLDNHPSR